MTLLLMRASSPDVVGSVGSVHEGMVEIRRARAEGDDDLRLVSLRNDGEVFDFTDRYVFTTQNWRGQDVEVMASTEWRPSCESGQHGLYPMTHFNPDGEDWETAFLSCSRCEGSAENPDFSE